MVSTMNILGISAYYHDSAAALLQAGKLTAAAQEERFSRQKHDPRFPSRAIQFCLENAQLSLENIDYVVFYDKPLLKFERLLETYLAYAPCGFSSFLQSMPIWLKEKLYLKTVLRRELRQFQTNSKSPLPRLLFTEHHQAHAASAFYPSPFQTAAILCLDGVGEWATTSAWLGTEQQMIPQWHINFPHSLGLLYSAFTYFAGFKVNSGEYKLMGLAPYGQPRYVQTILDNLLDLKEDGSFRLNLDYFNYTVGLTMTHARFEHLFDGPPRSPESPVTQREMDLACSIQAVTEEVILRLVRTLYQELRVKQLCLAGGVALNCVANGRILREGPFESLWIQPAAGDAGGALGAAYSVWHEYLKQPKISIFSPISDLKTTSYQGQEGSVDHMQGSYLGPKSSQAAIRGYLEQIGAPYHSFSETELVAQVAQLLADGQVVGWFQGRMEFGPRALGNRSILADPRSPKMQSTLNLKIKYRESFRPFAPSILAERVGDYFDLNCSSPYMLLVAYVKESWRLSLNKEQQSLFGLEKLHIPHSHFPAVTHLDYSARIQTVHQSTNLRYYALLKQFETLTGCPMLINTSFNVRGEPLVCTPREAYQCFMRTEMDYLVLENCVLSKQQQPRWSEKESWQQTFPLD